jgi:undecaprenyl-phosphate 4-deoxy-4-formamido-L-arabinose transferase
MNYSIIVPVYNGEKTVTKLFEKLKSFFDKNNFTYEVIFVYDCGKDNSWKVLFQLKNDFPEYIKLIKLNRNFGQHNALICGFEYAQGEFFITMDEDLQHEPDDIIKLIEKQKETDCDVIYGKYEERKHSVFRNVTSTILKKLIEIGIPDIHPDYSAFRLIKKNIAKATVEMRNSYTFLDGYLSWITTNVGSCIVTHNERQGGVSAYDLKKLLNHTINIFVTFSDLPIRILRRISFIVLFLMTFYGAYIIIRKIILDDFTMGYPALILTIGFGIGLIMFGLSILGEYIYRINLKTTKRPNYKVDRIY